MMSRKSVLLAIIFSLLLLFFYKKDTILILGDDFALNWVEQGEFFLQKTKLRIKASPKQSLSESINLLDDTPVVFYFLSRHQLYHFKDLPLEDILKQRLYHYDYFEKELKNFLLKILEKNKKVIVITRPVELKYFTRDCNPSQKYPSLKTWLDQYTESGKMEDLFLAAQMNCSCDSPEEIFNIIARKVTNTLNVPLIDFAEFIYQEKNFFKSHYKWITRAILYFFTI